jgi:hypothetical protein
MEAQKIKLLQSNLEMLADMILQGSTDEAKVVAKSVLASLRPPPAQERPAAVKLVEPKTPVEQKTPVSLKGAANVVINSAPRRCRALILTFIRAPEAVVNPLSVLLCQRFQERRSSEDPQT